MVYQSGANRPNVLYSYGPDGTRLSKTKIQSNGLKEQTLYIRDASGNILATYEVVNVKQFNPGEPSGNRPPIGAEYSRRLKETAIYGSSRLGMKQYPNALWQVYAPITTPPDSLSEGLVLENRVDWYSVSDRGGKYYEQSNHLGNVLAVVTDKKLYDISSSSYAAQVVSATDYFPFGWTIPDRIYNSSDYRFGFSGEEKDNSFAGYGYAFSERGYDARTGRWLSPDPLKYWYPGHTPYGYALSSPLLFKDQDGEFVITTILVISAAAAIGATIAVVTRKEGESVYVATGKGALSGTLGGVVGLIMAPAGLVTAGFIAGASEEMASQVLDFITGHRDHFDGKRVQFAGAIGGLLGYAGDIIDKIAIKVSVPKSFADNEAIGEAVETVNKIEKALSSATDAAEDVTRKAAISTTKPLPIYERVKKLHEGLDAAEPAKNADDAISLINRVLDEVEDKYSGIVKNPNADKMPNIQDGRMYGILDDRYVKRLPDGTVQARTRKNVIVAKKDGSFSIHKRDRSQPDQIGEVQYQKKGKEQ